MAPIATLSSLKNSIKLPYASAEAVMPLRYSSARSIFSLHAVGGQHTGIIPIESRTEADI